MTTLVLVRHGQASFGTSNYDRLSPLGERQAMLLGEHWQRCGIGLDKAFSGTMQRQRVTAERALSAIDHDPASIQTDAAFNEYDHQGLIRAYLPVMARRHPDISIRPDALLSDPKAFRMLFNLMVDDWMAGVPADGPVAESWLDFRQRCIDGALAAASTGERVVVFTSGGVITALLQKALGAADTVVRSMNWRIFNASVHVFHLGRDGLELTGFNDIAHLQATKDKTLLTRL